MKQFTSSPDSAQDRQLAMLDEPPQGRFVAIVVPLPLDGPFTYRLPSEFEVKPGQFVAVPFGKKTVIGVIWDAPADFTAEPRRIKLVERLIDTPSLPVSICQMIDQLAKETLAPRGGLLRLAMSVPSAFEPGPQKAMITWDADSLNQELPNEFRNVVDTLGRRGCLPTAAFTKQSKLTKSKIAKLIEKGCIARTSLDIDQLSVPQKFVYSCPQFSPEQDSARALLEEQNAAKQPSHVLLEGVPGSGKTEVYFDAIARTIERGGTALVLLPEIALSAQWLNRFACRFDVQPTLWHSGCTPAQRRKTWKDAAHGRLRVIVGTRSALFLPYPKLDLIVIDEEHDASYKQEDGVIYNARRAAQLRAEYDHALLVLVSATPSLESVVHLERDEGIHLKLTRSHGSATKLVFEIADMRSKVRHAGFLGRKLQDALRASLASGEQSILFLNRRGFAPLTTCGACGYRFDCDNCTAWLTTHRYRQRLLCHHCGASRPLPEHCPDCGALESTVIVGPGAERIADEAQRLLPDARIALVTSDTMTSGRKADQFIKSMESGDIDIVVGTQLVAKGHHFPNITLIGIVDADASLAASDPCASERCFQLLYQLSGRAGRADLPGKVVVQTRNPQNPVIEALCNGDREGFLALEREERSLAKLPPFGRLAALIVSGKDQRDVRHLGLKLVRCSPQMSGFRVLGPAPAPLAMLRGTYRERLLVKSNLAIDLPDTLRRWLSQVPVPSRLRLTIDVDPRSFY